MIKYRLVYSETPEGLSEDVTEYLKEGWSLHGSPGQAEYRFGMMGEHAFFQAMVLYSPEPTEVLPGYTQRELATPEEIIEALNPKVPEGVIAYP
jgi:hypothetical protein